MAQLAAQNATAEGLRELERIIARQKEGIDSGKNIIETDSAFHSTIARMSKKRALERLMLALVDLLEETREASLLDDVRARESLAGHQKILSAIEDGDCSAARQAMLHHLSDLERLLFNKRKGGGKCDSLE